MDSMELRRYITADGHEPVTDWLRGLRDRTARARIEIWLARVLRPARPDRRVLLLVGGDKRTQAEDIPQAITYWQDFKRRQA